MPMGAPDHDTFLTSSPLLARSKLLDFRNPVFPPILPRTVQNVERKTLHAGGRRRTNQSLKESRKEYVAWTFWDLQGRPINIPTRCFLLHGRNGNANTLQQYAYDVSQFLRTIDVTLAHAENDLQFMNPWPGCRTVDEVLVNFDQEDMRNYLSQLLDSVETVTAKRHEAALQKVFRYMRGNFSTVEGPYRNDIPWDINHKGKLISLLPPTGQSDKVHITSEELIALLSEMDDEPLRVATHFLYESGLRLEEFLNFTMEDLYGELARTLRFKSVNDLINSSTPLLPPLAKYFAFVVNGGKSRTPGKGKKRKTFVCRPFFNRMLSYHRSCFSHKFAPGYVANPASNKPLFLDSDGLPWTPKKLRYRIRKAAEKAGLDAKRMVPKSMRSSAAQNIIKSTLGKKLIDRLLLTQSMLGHEQIETTQKSYVDVQTFLLEATAIELIDLPAQSAWICKATQSEP